MSDALVIRGRYVDRTFIPEGPLPDADGTAELIIVPTTAPTAVSIFELFGKAPRLRTAAEIAAQLREERDAWGEP